MRSDGAHFRNRDLYQLAKGILGIDILLLVFNMLPIYPLDGGQILRSLLWFVVGKARSLQAATIIGFVGAAGLVMLAIKFQSSWSFLVAGFIVLNCWGGSLQECPKALLKIEKRASSARRGFECPGVAECLDQAAGYRVILAVFELQFGI